MEVSGVSSHQKLPIFHGDSRDLYSSKSSSCSLSVGAGTRFPRELRVSGGRNSGGYVKLGRLCGAIDPGFGDDGHLRYYNAGPRCGMKKEKEKEKKEKASKRLKLLEGLSKDLNAFSRMGFGLDNHDGVAAQDLGIGVSEATEVLLKQLQQLIAEEKQLNKKMKLEMADTKAACTETIMDCESSTSSESSDSECDEVIDVSSLRGNFSSQQFLNGLESKPGQGSTLVAPSLSTLGRNIAEEQAKLGFNPQGNEEKCCNRTNANIGSSSVVNGYRSCTAAGETAKIEVCMGNKCSKSGSPALLAEFKRILGVEGAVTGCKCMGKCKDGPNVRVSYAGSDNSAVAAANPLCIGVAVEDVGAIVANFLRESQINSGLAAAP